MDVFEKYKEGYKIIVASLASIITAFLLTATGHYFTNQIFAKIIIVTLVILVMYLGNTLIDKFIDNSVVLRKILMGKKFIEGFYYDISIDKNSRTIKHGVLFRLTYENGLYKANGVTYNLEGNKVATWKSNGSCFTQDALFIQYESYTDYSNSFIEHGLMQLQFDQPPTSYTGFYIDYTNSLRFLIRGVKVTDTQLKDHNNFTLEENRHIFLLEILKKEQNNIQNQSNSNV